MSIYGSTVGGQGYVTQAGNADTLDGKQASEFAVASDVEDIKLLVGDVAVSEQISSAITTALTWVDF